MALKGFENISFPVGNNLQNSINDVKNVKTYLNRLGYYQREVENGYIDREMDDAIFRFQADYDLKQDGIMLPGGETEGAMRKAFMRRVSEEGDEAPEEQPEEDELPEEQDPPEEDEEDKCESEKEEFEIAEEEYASKEDALNEAESTLEQLKEELQEVDEALNKENNDRKNYGKGGRIIGGAIGSRIPGFRRPGVRIGGKFGKYIGEEVEEFVDDFQGISDAELQKRKQELESRISEIEQLIETKLIPELEEAQKRLEIARENLNSCQSKTNKS